MVFAVLADPRRREILDLLRPGELTVGSLAAHLRVSQPAVSKHLKVLREAGLVEVRQDAQRRLYRVRPGPLAELDAWLAPYRALWTAHLDALERHLDTTPEPTMPEHATPHQQPPGHAVPKRPRRPAVRDDSCKSTS